MVSKVQLNEQQLKKSGLPTLDTLKMIEETIKSNNRKYSKTELWEHLPRKVMYQTYKVGLDYLTLSPRSLYPELVRV